MYMVLACKILHSFCNLNTHFHQPFLYITHLSVVITISIQSVSQTIPVTDNYSGLSKKDKYNI